MIFTASLCLFVGALFYLTLDLGPVARFVPIYVVVPTLALLVFQLILDLFPRWAEVYERKEKAEIVDVDIVRDESVSPGNWSVAFWLLLPLVLVVLVGFVVGTPIFTALYLKGSARETWRLSLAASAVIWALVYGVFVTLLGARLYDGWIF